MASNFGTGVTRTLSALKTQYQTCIFQAGKPPLDSEVNLISSIQLSNFQQMIQSQMSSGFIIDPTRALDDYQFNPNWASYFMLGNPVAGDKNPPIYANVNGWIIPVTGTHTTLASNADNLLANIIKLYPPPTASDSERIDFVFLEAWACRVNPNPSIANKPAKDKIWPYGNTQFGDTANLLPDTIEDPAVGFQTTARIQVQYRLRVYGSGEAEGNCVDLFHYPDGLGDPVIKGQGTLAAPPPPTPPTITFPFLNMGTELGDPSLWRAGDGEDNDLGTLDGYTYAIPICAIFRRNSSTYSAASTSPNQNGSYYRTPSVPISTDALSGARTLNVATLSDDLNETDGILAPATIYITNLVGSGFDEVTVFPFRMILDNEIVSISSMNLITGTVTIPIGGRGRFASAVTNHTAGTSLKFFNTRPDNLFTDQIIKNDILDLRHAVNTQDWDYYRLLEHNVMSLVKNELRTTWKGSASGNTEGVSVHEVDVLYAGTLAPAYPQTTSLDGPDGVRTIWSDSAAIQPDVTLLLDPTGVQGQVDNLTSAIKWEVDPGFAPWGFLNNFDVGTGNWTDGSVIFMAIGGTTGDLGARGTFNDSTVKAVRALLPPEYWKALPAQGQPATNEYPVSIRFEGQRAFEGLPANLPVASLVPPVYSDVARHPGPMAPCALFNFERPLIVLGAILNQSFVNKSIASTALSTGGSYSSDHEIDLGINFDLSGSWYYKDPVTNNFTNDPALVSQPLNHGMRTLYGMLTNNGADNTGASSELYIVLWGDTVSWKNNGIFKVIGAGTTGYTTNSASTATSIRVIPLYTAASGWVGFNSGSVQTIHVELRAQYHNSYDASEGGITARVDDLCIGLTDLLGTSLGTDGQLGSIYPWDRANLGYEDTYDLSMPFEPFTQQTEPTAYDRPAIPTKLLLNMTLLYHPGRSGFARCPDDIVRFGMVYQSSLGPYLRQSKALIDPTFATAVGMPADESYWDPVHIQMWNRLPSCGLSAPSATYYGGGVVGGTEQDREHELFIDRGSKTVIFRPFRKRSMTLNGYTENAVPANCLLGTYTYATEPTWNKGASVLFTGTATSGKQMGVAVPKEFMPRFGRQDIPYWQDIDNSQSFLCGINHLFADNVDVDDSVFQIIGGEKVGGSGAGVKTQVFFTKPDGASYGFQEDLTASSNVRKSYVARKSTDIDPTANVYTAEIAAKFSAVRSSDLGVGLKGIQLPPYLGVARLLGVYTMEDYLAAGGITFNAFRTTMETGHAPNLLRIDATQQTLFIMQGGARDLTQGETDDLSDGRDDHTYIIPSNAIDITLANDYDPVTKNKFEDFEYVVETTVFGFARGFINKNNYVLIRLVDGKGTTQKDKIPSGQAAVDYEIDGINMVIPCPAGYHDVLYTAYNRTAYQGDAYMTRTQSDYLSRYGQISIPHQYAVETPILQYDSNGAFIPEVTNPTAFEVLASMDFYTTYGTGKIGGRLLPGTYLDNCYTENTYDAALRKPTSREVSLNTSDQWDWRVLPRTFTAGQTQNNTARASVIFSIEDYHSLVLEAAKIPTAYNTTIRFNLPNNTVVDMTSILNRYMELAPLPPPTSNTGYWSLYWGYGANVETQTHTFDVSLYPGQATVIDTLLHPEITWGDTLEADDCFVAYPDATGSTAQTQPDYVKLLDVIPFIDSFNNLNLVIRHIGTDTPFAYLTGQSDATPIVQCAATITWASFILPNTFTNATITGNFDFGTNFNTDNLLIRFQNYNRELIPVVKSVTRAGTVTTIAVQLYNFGTTQVDKSHTTVILTAFEPSIRTEITSIPVKISRTSYHNSITENLYRTMQGLAAQINNHPILKNWINAEYEWQGSASVQFYSLASGIQGEALSVEIKHPTLYSILNYAQLKKIPLLQYPLKSDNLFGCTKTNFLPTYDNGHDTNLQTLDSPINAGDGASPISLAGITERLPLGILLQDCDFLCEDPLNDDVSGMKASPAALQPIQNLLVPTQSSNTQSYVTGSASGEEYDRFTGEPGLLFTVSQGTTVPTNYAAWNGTVGSGTKTYRTYRGGPSFVLSGTKPGGPIDWVAGSFSAPMRPVLKGGLLACRALLVRNFTETPNGYQTPVSAGDEIQMVMLTYGILGNEETRVAGVSMHGTVSPAGYGEGYAAVDRYRIAGHPMFRSYSRKVPDSASVQIAPYPTERVY